MKQTRVDTPPPRQKYGVVVDTCVLISTVKGSKYSAAAKTLLFFLRAHHTGYISRLIREELLHTRVAIDIETLNYLEDVFVPPDSNRELLQRIDKLYDDLCYRAQMDRFGRSRSPSLQNKIVLNPPTYADRQLLACAAYLGEQTGKQMYIASTDTHFCLTRRGNEVNYLVPDRIYDAFGVICDYPQGILISAMLKQYFDPRDKLPVTAASMIHK